MREAQRSTVFGGVGGESWRWARGSGRGARSLSAGGRRSRHIPGAENPRTPTEAPALVPSGARGVGKGAGPP